MHRDRLLYELQNAQRQTASRPLRVPNQLAYNATGSRLATVMEPPAAFQTA
jgi:hypothetical protein